jgi:phosphoribosylanthranilate isomerase
MSEHPVFIRTRVKICCIASVEEAQMAIRAGADAVGLLGLGAMPSSPRAIDDRTVAAIVAIVPPPVAAFLLTSESTASGIAQRVLAAGGSTVQIVSHLSPGESEQLPRLLPTTQRVQVIHVESESALDLIPRYAPHVHAFLLDSGGGTGRTHDWSVSAEFVRRSPHPVFLAGGLSPANVGEAIRRVRPFGVDLCTGVRTEGRLDPDKLEAFFDAVRRTE